MEVGGRGRRKRKHEEVEKCNAKHAKKTDGTFHFTTECKTGKVKKILMRNFMCHDALEVVFNPNVNFIIGRNGSGKSAILTALTVGLGARANVTSRGASVKNFIKKGKNSATIEVVLLNTGPMAYKSNVYGDSITVVRTIGNSSNYKMKNSKGELVSTKRNELDNILRAMNIQIDNPISVLNQDISRTFLVSSKPEEKYDLFMKATLLDVIGNNYKEAELICLEESEKIKHYNETLSEVRKEVEQLKENIKRAEEIDEFRKEATNLDMELHWAIAIEEETKLKKVKEVFKKCEDGLKQLKDSESFAESKENEINKKIQALNEEIEQTEREISSDFESYNKIKQEYSVNKDTHATKVQEWRSVQRKIKRLQDDIEMIQKEIQRLESDDNAEQNKRSETKRQLTATQEKLNEVEALLRTKKTDQMHLENDKMRLSKEIQSSKFEINNYDNRIQKLQREVSARKQYSDNALAVFGRDVPRLLRRIEEEYTNGQFKEKPRGPLGACIKIRDSAWAPAVESYLGRGTLTTFCVDNSHDAKVLTRITKEIYLNDRTPQIVCSKFYHKVHDVSAHCASSPNYSNLLNMMDISDPVVANCLIDQNEVECVMLIPTSDEAADILSDISRVPRNCKKAITQQGDTFFPDPHYRSYGGPRNLRSKFLQVSVSDTIKALEEEICTVENEKKIARQSYIALCEKEKRVSAELMSVIEKIAKLTATQHQYKASINDLKDEIQSYETASITMFKNELKELEKKLQDEKREESRLNENVTELQKIIERLEEEVKHSRETRQSLDSKIIDLRESIKQLENEKEEMHANNRHAAKKLQALRQALQNAQAELETQQRCTNKAVSEAEAKCEKINTERSVSVLQRLSKELKRKIHEIESKFGTIDDLRKELKKKEAKCGRDIRLISKIEKGYQQQLERLQIRKNRYNDMKTMYSVKIKKSFQDALNLRNRKGTINIDHGRKTLELEVHAQNDKKSINDARSLSGGERSYSTVSFILALWECTDLPFYFLDEFDVFMDKINRRIIMDILLDHAKTHPQSQFVFLTPLDTSHVLIQDHITIHRLAEPEREGKA